MRWIATCAAAVTVCACGNAFTSGGPTTSSDAGVDSSTDAGRGPEADAAAPPDAPAFDAPGHAEAGAPLDAASDTGSATWCQTQASTAVLCDDFENPSFPLPIWQVLAVDAKSTLSRHVGGGLLGSASMLSQTPAATPPTGRRLRAVHVGSITGNQCGASFKVSGSSAQPDDGASVLTWVFQQPGDGGTAAPRVELSFVVAAGQLSFNENDVAASGQGAGATTLLGVGPVGWAALQLRIVDDAHVEVSATDGTALDYKTTLPLSSSLLGSNGWTLYVGLADYSQAATASDGWTADYDDVLCL